MESLPIKYRPHCFAEVVGQPTIISILSRQIETKTFRNSYLFAGPSGCGKTTVARIMASEINGHDGEPIEIDAASNNGVDNIRQLIVDAQQTSIDSDYKVYIIDECHMLTNAAWNAALKLIEEPPSHSIFIFCTTNPNKIPETILTRVQRFDFRRVSIKDISDRLEYICNEELIVDYEQSALQRIAALSNGFVREAVSLLEKCVGYSNNISLDNVEKVLGCVKYDTLFNLLDALYNKKQDRSMEIINGLKESNSDLISVFDDILGFLIECAKYQKTNNILLTKIPSNYKNSLDKYKDDLMVFVDRAFKFRQMCLTVETDTILDILILDLCRR